jgi:hypothetical protein
MKKISQTWSDAVYWLIYNLAGIIIPVGISILAVCAMKLTFSLGAITNGGQFAIYSAAMSITTIYLIAKPYPKRLPFTEIFGLLCLLTFAAGVALFVLAILHANGMDIATWVLEWPTIALFVICAGVTFFAVVADNRRIEMGQKELRLMTQSRLDSLNKDFDNIG